MEFFFFFSFFSSSFPARIAGKEPRPARKANILNIFYSTPSMVASLSLSLSIRGKSSTRADDPSFPIRLPTAYCLVVCLECAFNTSMASLTRFFKSLGLSSKFSNSAFSNSKSIPVIFPASIG